MFGSLKAGEFDVNSYMVGRAQPEADAQEPEEALEIDEPLDPEEAAALELARVQRYQAIGRIAPALGVMKVASEVEAIPIKPGAPPRSAPPLLPERTIRTSEGFALPL